MKINIIEEFKLIGGQEIYAVQLLEMLMEKSNFTINFYTSIEGFNYIKSNYPGLKDALKMMPENTINQIFFIKREFFSTYFGETNLRNVNICNSFKLSVIFSILKIIFFYKRNILFVINHLSTQHLSEKVTFLKLKLIRILDKFISISSRRVCISKEIYASYKRFNKNVNLIENCMPKDNYENSFLGEGDFTSEISFIGRLDTQKGINYLCLLISNICNEDYISKIEIAGIGDLECKIKDLEKLSPKIKYYSFINKPFAKIKSKIMLFPSLYEGFPLSLLEAVKNGSLPLTSNIVSYKNVLPSNYPTLKSQLKTDKQLIKKILLKQDYHQKIRNQITSHFYENYSFNSWEQKWLDLLNIYTI